MAFKSIIQRRPVTPSGVAKLNRNDWPQSIGIAGQIQSQRVATLDQNQWPKCVGICKTTKTEPNSFMNEPILKAL